MLILLTDHGVIDELWLLLFGKPRSGPFHRLSLHVWKGKEKNQSTEDIDGEEGALLVLPVLPCNLLPNNVFTCTFLLLAVGGLISEPFSALLHSQTCYWTELWVPNSL